MRSIRPLSLSPYLWRTKRLGDIRKNIKINDIVYLRHVDRLGVVLKLAESQLYVLYKDGGDSLRKEWLLKNDLMYIAAGTSLVDTPYPEAIMKDMGPIVPEKFTDHEQE